MLQSRGVCGGWKVTWEANWTVFDFGSRIMQLPWHGVQGLMFTRHLPGWWWPANEDRWDASLKASPLTKMSGCHSDQKRSKITREVATNECWCCCFIMFYLHASCFNESWSFDGSSYCNLGHEMGRNLLKMDQISLCNTCHFLSRIQGLNNTLDRINWNSLMFKAPYCTSCSSATVLPQLWHQFNSPLYCDLWALLAKWYFVSETRIQLKHPQQISWVLSIDINVMHCSQRSIE